ncbi:MAG TPA: hypothetical protein VHE14_07385 [Solirubrobacteraceae bacterium]|nr:hypothetical protein [Solirubrobacteraceae bacterium]
MNILRRLPTSRLLLLSALIVAVAAGGTAIAIAASGGGAAPAPKALGDAIHDALAAPPVEGVTGRIQFSNHLIAPANLDGAGDPLLSGASGRLWLSRDGHVRLELQSSAGDVQVLSDSKTFSVYDASANTVYRGDLPQDAKDPQPGAAGAPADAHQVPTVAKIQDALTRLMQKADVSGATPTNVAGQPAYSVRISPKADGGLLGGGELAFDAARGVPLRAAVYAKGNPTPVLELTATDISYGPVPASDFAVVPPPGAKVVQIAQHGGADKSRPGKPVTDPAEVQKAVGFQLADPATLAGLPLTEVRLLDWQGSPAALVSYGKGLGGVVVIERKPKQDKPGPSADGQNGRSSLSLPKISIGGASGSELTTALGTAVMFDRGGVSYTVLGSVPAATAEAAARGL